MKQPKEKAIEEMKFIILGKYNIDYPDGMVEDLYDIALAEQQKEIDELKDYYSIRYSDLRERKLQKEIDKIKENSIPFKMYRRKADGYIRLHKENQQLKKDVLKSYKLANKLTDLVEKRNKEIDDLKSMIDWNKVKVTTKQLKRSK